MLLSPCMAVIFVGLPTLWRSSCRTIVWEIITSGLGRMTVLGRKQNSSKAATSVISAQGPFSLKMAWGSTCRPIEAQLSTTCAPSVGNASHHSWPWQSTKSLTARVWIQGRVGSAKCHCRARRNLLSTARCIQISETPSPGFAVLSACRRSPLPWSWKFMGRSICRNWQETLQPHRPMARPCKNSTSVRCAWRSSGISRTW